MKLLKRLLLLLCVVIVLGLALLGVGYYYARQVPVFYKQYAWDPAQRSKLNQQAVDKIALTRNMAQAAYFGPQQSRNSTRPAPPTAPVRVALTEEEINAFISQNSEFPEVREQYEKYLTKPAVFFRDGHVILAGQVQGFDSIVSLHFDPVLMDGGKLRLRLDSSMAGRLSVPRALLPIGRVEKMLRDHLPAWRREAKIDAAGGFNTSAVAAATAQFFLAALADQPGEAVLFIPIDKKDTSVPLAITELTVEDGQLTLTASPMAPQQRQSLFNGVLGKTSR